MQKEVSDWNKRYKNMLKELHWNNHNVAEITGNTYDSVKSTTQPNKDFPRNLKLAIVVYERMSESVQIGDKK